MWGFIARAGVVIVSTIVLLTTVPGVTSGPGVRHHESVAATVKLPGSNNEQKVLNYWTSHGLTQQQAAGITGSLQNAADFSPFRQEEAVSWPQGGYGIAQFTGGQRSDVASALKEQLSAATFAKYYSPKYGGNVTKADGYAPAGTKKVNDAFLRIELDYLLHRLSSYVPNSAMASALQSQYGLQVPSGKTLMAYLKSLPTASATAEAWTYLYEVPGNPAQVAARNVSSAEAIAGQ